MAKIAIPISPSVTAPGDQEHLNRGITDAQRAGASARVEMCGLALKVAGWVELIVEGVPNGIVMVERRRPAPGAQSRA